MKIDRPILVVAAICCTIFLIACEPPASGMRPTPRPAATFSISGTVSKADNALAGVSLSIGEDRQTTSDDMGRFTFSDLPAGSYSVRTTYDGHLIFPTEYNRHVTLSDSNLADLGFTAIELPSGVTRGPSIAQIQGATHTSPMVGLVSNVVGIVTKVRTTTHTDSDSGALVNTVSVFIQAPDPDNDPATSEGLQIYLGEDPASEAIPEMGDLVSVRGTATEHSFASTDLSITQITGSIDSTGFTPPTITVLADSLTLPSPIVIGSGGRIPPNRFISNGAISGIFRPEDEGIDFYESLEHMRVRLNDARVVSGYVSFRYEVSVVGDNGRNAGLNHPRGGVLLSRGEYANPEVLSIDTDYFDLAHQITATQTGDTFADPILGIMGYSFTSPRVFVTERGMHTPGAPAREVTTLTGTSNRLSMATFNLFNLAGNSPVAKFQDLAETIVTGLKAPDIIGLQEVQDNNGETDDTVVTAAGTLSTLISAIEAAGGPRYVYKQINPARNADGGAPGSNIRVALLYNPGRVNFDTMTAAGGTIPAGDATTNTAVRGTTSADISLNPGRILDTTVSGSTNAFNASRKPIVGKFDFNGQKLFVVVAHFNSKRGDGAVWGRTQPFARSSEVQRSRQATMVNGFVRNLLEVESTANVVVLGDLNDFYYSNVLARGLQGSQLENLIERLPELERYSFQFSGNSQILDHILVSNAMESKFEAIDIVHRYSEYDATRYDPASPSSTARHGDHDPVVATFNFPESSDTELADMDSRSDALLWR